MTTGLTPPRPLPITVPDRPGSSWPEASDPAHARTVHLLAYGAAALSVAYLLFRVLWTLTLASVILGVPLLILETWTLASFALTAMVLWDVDSAVRPEPITETDSTVAVLIPTVDEPHHALLPALMAAARMRLATHVIVLDDGHRAWLAGTCDELGIEYRPRLRHLGGRAGQLNSALDTLDTDFVVVLDPDQVATRDFLGHCLPHFDDEQVALVVTPRDTYSLDSFEHVEVGRQRLSERTLRERLLGTGRNRWNAAFWHGGSVVLRRSALAAIGGFADGATDIVTSARLQAEGLRTVQHDEVLARGIAAADSADYLDEARVDATTSMVALRAERFMTRSGLTLPQRLSYLQALTGGASGWRSLGYLVLPALALLLALTPATGPVEAFIAFMVVVGVLRRVATASLDRGRLARSNADVFVLLRMAASLGTWTALVTGRSPARVAGESQGARRVPVVLWLVLFVNVVAVAWAALALSGVIHVDYPIGIIAAGAALWAVLNIVRVLRAVARVRSSVFGGDRRQATRVEVDGHVFVDGERVHMMDLSLTGVRVLTYGTPQTVGSYCSVMFTDPSRRPAVVTGTVVAVDVRPHGHEMRIGLEDDQTYVLGAILADALIRRG